MNSVTLIGNVGKDPETRQTQNSSVTNTTLATTYGEDTEWHNLQAWGKASEIIQKYVKKGDKIAIQGRIKTETWEKDGERKYKTVIVVNTIEMLGSKKD